MEHVPDSVLLETLKKEENSSFGVLYDLYFPMVASYIKQNSGSREDSEDVFQEAIVVLLQKVRQPDFELTSSLKTYFYAISRNIWLKRLRDNKATFVDVSTLDFERETFEIENEKPNEEKVISWLTKITENCQRILKAIFFYHEPMSSLIEKMGWKNKHTAANQQYKCIQQVRKERQKEERLQ